MTKKGDKRPKYSISDRDEGVFYKRKVQKGKKGSRMINIPSAIAKKLGLEPGYVVYLGWDRNKNSKPRIIIELYPIEELGGQEITRIKNSGHGENKPSGMPEKESVREPVNTPSDKPEKSN